MSRTALPDSTRESAQPESPSSGMNSMNRSWNPSRRQKEASGTISSSVSPRTETALILISRNPTALAAASPASTRSSPGRRAIRAKTSGLRASRLTFSRSSPARRSDAACSSSSRPLVVIATSSMPGTRTSIATSRSTSRRSSGSPPVMRRVEIPSSAAIRATRAISSYESSSSPGLNWTSSGMQ